MQETTWMSPMGMLGGKKLLAKGMVSFYNFEMSKLQKWKKEESEIAGLGAKEREWERNRYSFKRKSEVSLLC